MQVGIHQMLKQHIHLPYLQTLIYQSSNFKIYLKDLLYLWENGFTYNDFPITEFGDIIRQSRYVAINYVEDNKEKSIILVNGKDKELISYYKRLFLQHKSLNIAHQYPNWQTYKTIKDMIKIVKKEN